MLRFLPIIMFCITSIKSPAVFFTDKHNFLPATETVPRPKLS